MSNKNLFWSTWEKPYRYLFSIVLFFLLSLLIVGCIAWWCGTENIIDWNVISTLKQSVSEVSLTTVDGLVLKTREPIFYITEKYVPTGSKVSELHAFIFIGGLIVGLCLFLSATLRLSSLWFMLGIALLGVILMGFGLEMVFNQLNKLPFLLPFIVIAGTAYYFNSWAKRNDIIRTLPVFMLLFIALVACIYKLGVAPMPLLLISNRVVGIAMFVTAIFIFFIAHEIIAGIVKVTTTNSIQQKSSLWQFVLAATIYLLNVVLIYLENANKINWSSIVIDPWWLFITSFALGLWGFRNYCQQTERLSYQQSGGWMYVGLGFISISTCYYLFVTDNTPWIELLADFIAITHLVVGITFLGHILINFIQPLNKGLAVYKIIYKPPFSRLILARLVAIFGIFILFSFKSYYSFNQYLAGYYNSLGDYSLNTNELFVAETYYKKSVAYDTYNHKGNYALASLAQSQNDATTAGFYFKQALFKTPTPYAYVGLSESLLQENLPFDATFILKDGIGKFPTDEHLLTNISSRYENASITDSSFIYAMQAYEHCGKCDVESTNLLSFWLENAKMERLDSVVNAINKSHGTSAKATIAAIYKKGQKASVETNFSASKDSILSVSQFALLYNLVSNPLNPSIISDKALQRIQQKPENNGYFSDLTFLRAKQNYYFEDKSKAIEQISYLTRDETQETHLYDLTLGNWFLNEGVYQKAINAFSKAYDSTSVRNLELAQYEQKIDANTKNVANRLFKTPLTVNNYEQAISKAPFNPFVVEKVVDLLNKNNKIKEAYDIVFNAVQTNEESVVLWKLYTLQALKMGLTSYAEDGLKQLKALSSKDEIDAFLVEYNKLNAKNDGF